MGEIMGNVVAGKWYVMVGLDTTANKPMAVVYVYDPAADAWTAKKPMPVPAHHVITTVFNGNIYVFGGFVSNPGVAVWKPTDHSTVYAPSSDSWKDLALMPTPRGAVHARNAATGSWHGRGI
jgi:N-acetylneuraminic acid mutarotase